MTLHTDPAVVYLASLGLTTLAPILINLVCKVRNYQWQIDLGNAKRRRKLPRL